MMLLSSPLCRMATEIWGYPPLNSPKEGLSLELKDMHEYVAVAHAFSARFVCPGSEIKMSQIWHPALIRVTGSNAVLNT